jgi:hypothetical protein
MVTGNVFCGIGVSQKWNFHATQNNKLLSTKCLASSLMILVAAARAILETFRLGHLGATSHGEKLVGESESSLVATHCTAQTQTPAVCRGS